MSPTITADQVQDRVQAALVELGVEPKEVSRDATFEGLDVDSLDLVELAQMVEDEFGVELDGSDVQDLRTVGEAIDLVVARAS
jgi:acyl carrier protein